MAYSFLEAVKQVSKTPAGRRIFYMLVGGYGLMILVMAFSMSFSLRQQTNIVEITQGLIHDKRPVTARLQNLELLLHRSHVLVVSFALTKAAQYLDNHRTTESEIRNALDEIHKMAQTNPDDGRAIEELYSNVASATARLLDSTTGSSGAILTAVDLQEIDIAYQRIIGIVEKMRLENMRSAEADTRHLDSETQNLISVNINVMVLSLLVGLFVILVVFRMVFKLLMILEENRMHLIETNQEAEEKAVQLEKAGYRLNQANEELTESLDELQRTQAELVEKEKMASLGGLVAGIAHEINTPVGIGVTAASNLQERVQRISSQLQEGKMKKSELEEFFEKAIQGSNIILTNLQRASKLISSFKQVSVDQSGDVQRDINMRQYIDEILISLQPKLKKTRHHLEVICDPDLHLMTYPGAISQIITNLIMNSLLHAFEDQDSGKMSIEVQVHEGDLILLYCDNGKGMTDEVKNHIFDPFFTTKRGAGGSGLGMHIVFNLVTQKLQGHIQLHTKMGEGTRFGITFPLHLH